VSESARALAVELGNQGWCVRADGMFDEPPDEETVELLDDALRTVGLLPEAKTS
jgi:hypothetical protein